MIRALLLIPLTVAGFLGCSSDGRQVHFVVPVGFTGPIQLILDESDGTEIVDAQGKFTYRIPADGVLHVTTFKPLENLHQKTAAYEDGTPIPQEHETWAGPHGEPPKIGKNLVVFQGGGMSQQNGQPPVQTYFVGTALAYEEWQRRPNRERRGF